MPPLDSAADLTDIFPVTDTRLLRAAMRRDGSVDQDTVWRALIDAYAAPIALTLRRHLSNADDGDVRAFFGFLYEREALARFDRERSRFRCFVQGVARNFAHERRRERLRASSIEDAEFGAEGAGEAPYGDLEQADEAAWANQVLERALVVFAAERPRDARILAGHHGLGGQPRTTHAELARELGTTANAIGVAVHAAHRRLGDLLRAQVRAQCPRDAQDFEDELDVVLRRLRDARPGLTFD